jgi:tetrahydromethanopterin S-methyltransferase subunit G
MHMAVTDLERFSRIVLDEFKRVHERFDEVDERFDAIDARFKQSEARLDRIDERLTNIEHEIGDIHRRLDTLQELVESQSGFAKEIDHLLRRIAAIEKHLGLQHNIKA